MTALLYLIVCLCWGTTWLAIEMAVESVPPLTSAGARFLIAFPMFVAFALSRGEAILYPRDHLPFFLFVTVFYFAVPYWMINFGEQFVSSGLTALLFSTMPVFILIFSWLILKDRILLSQAVGILFGFFGLTMIIMGQGMHLSFSSKLGVAAILLAAAMHALSYVVTKRFGGEIGIVTFNTLPIGVAGVALTASGMVLEQPDFSTVTMQSILALLYLGVVASVGGFIVYFHLLKQLSPVVLSFVFIIFPAISVAIDAWYDHVPLNDHFVLFMIVLLAGFSFTKFPLETLLTRFRKGADATLRALTPDALGVLAAHASQEYPQECCGIVFADGTVHRATNIQDRLAGDQPGRYTRTAATGFTLSVADTLMLNASFGSPNPAVALYHSHPDVGAYFSAEDKDKALFAGVPLHPIDHLVIDAQADGARETKLFAWNGEDFACVKTIHLKSSVQALQ